jgi:hypothetical protein
MAEEVQTVTMYRYEKEGVVYYTPNEHIAAQRSDTGEYFIEHHVISK